MASRDAVFVVDDSDDFRDWLTFSLEAAGYGVTAFSSAQAFLNAFDTTPALCVVTDVRMPAMSGLELQGELNRRGARLPVIVVTGDADVPLAVSAMRSGAVDFLEKPFPVAALLASIGRAKIQRQTKDDQAGGSDAAREKIAQLTRRERQVMELLAEGHQNKVIAHRLDISPRTVEIHRAHVMEKLAVRNLPELVRLSIAGGAAG